MADETRAEEVHVVRDDPAVAISDVVPPELRKRIKELSPVEVPSGQGKAPYRQILPGVLQLPADAIIALARKSSLWPLTFGLACCAIEMIAAHMARHDLDRFGILPWPSPRQADVPGGAHGEGALAGAADGVCAGGGADRGRAAGGALPAAPV